MHPALRGTLAVAVRLALTHRQAPTSTLRAALQAARPTVPDGLAAELQRQLAQLQARVYHVQLVCRLLVPPAALPLSAHLPCPAQPTGRR